MANDVNLLSSAAGKPVEPEVEFNLLRRKQFVAKSFQLVEGRRPAKNIRARRQLEHATDHIPFPLISPWRQRAPRTGWNPHREKQSNPRAPRARRHCALGRFGFPLQTPPLPRLPPQSRPCGRWNYYHTPPPPVPIPAHETLLTPSSPKSKFRPTAFLH